MLAGETDGEAEFFGRLAQFLSRPDTPDYPALVASAGSDTALADALRMACVRDALQRQLIVHAFELVVPLPKTPAQAERWERLLVEVLEAILLLAGKVALCRFLANGFKRPCSRSSNGSRPIRPSRRSGSVSRDSCSRPSLDLGLALMASVVLKLASRPITLDKREAPGHAKMDWLLEREFLPERRVRVVEGAATRGDRTGCPARGVAHRTGR